MGSHVPGPDPELVRLRQEQGELWQWVHRLERLAEAGLQARGLAHDLGNTLTSLMAGSELALQQGGREDLQRALQRSLELSRTAAQRLHAYMRYTSRGAEGEDAAGTPLSDAVEDALAFLAHPMRKARVEIECDYECNARVPGSRPELLQVVGTALLAVIEGFGPPGGILTIHLEELGDDVVLQVRRAAVAGSAAREHAWWSRGSGLELTVARRIVASLGGRIDLSPGAPLAQLCLPTVGAGARAHSWHDASGRGAAAFEHHPAEDRARRA